jgi:drug/metabolite transporter (DMT)-like permease
MSILAFIYWQPTNISSYFLFLGTGIFFSLGVYFQIIALTRARASVIQPFHYTLIFWAIILGFIFYGDIPDAFTLIGALVITISGIFVINQTTKE